MMSKERWVQLASLRTTLTAARLRVTHVTTALGLQPRPGQVCAMVACPVDPGHRVKEENLPRHASACLWQKHGYHADEMPLPGEQGDLSLVISNEEARCIIQEELSKNPKLKTGSHVQITTTRVVCRPAAVGGLIEGCQPKTWQRITVDFTPDERRTIYDHVVAVTAPRRCSLPPELAFLGPAPVRRHDDEVGDSLVAKMAAERDARRRRVSQKKVSTNRKSHLEVLREVIGNQMQLYSEWLGDANDEVPASADGTPQQDSNMALSEVQHAQRPSETVDLQAKETEQNWDYNRYRDKGRDDRGRELMSGNSRRGVRFKEDNGRPRDWDRNWEGKEKERLRGRDVGCGDYIRHREKDRDVEGNQFQRGSHVWPENKDGRERNISWEGKDKHRERFGGREDKARCRERHGDEGEMNKRREKDAGYNDGGKEHERRREDSSWNNTSLRNKKDAYSRRYSGREERFREKKDRTTDGDWERLDDRLTEEKRGYRVGCSEQEHEKRVEVRSENIATFVVKQEQESDEEAPVRESDYDSVVRVKTEREGDYVANRGKRKREKDYDWSEDSEKEAKKQNKKKKKKHKKHKKKKAHSSSEFDSS